MKKIYLMLFALVFYATGAWAQFAVTTNGGSGLAATYTSLANAITALNAATITSPVVITCAAGAETNPSGGYSITATGTATNTIIIQGAGASSSVITAPSPAGTAGNLNDAIFKIIGGDYITIQGFAMNENSANIQTSLTTNTMVEWGVALLYTSLTNGAQNNTIQNNTITLNKTYPNSFGIYSNTRHSATAVTTTAEVTSAAGANSYNKVYSNTISNVNYGIVFIGAGTTLAAIDNGNDIGGSSLATGNTITNWGGLGTATSAYTSLTANVCGVYFNQQINDNISYNTITSSAAGASGSMTASINGIMKGYTIAVPAAATTFSSNINYNNINVSAAPITTFVQGISSTAVATTAMPLGTFNINNNTISSTITGAAATTGAIVGITNTSVSYGVLNINNNIFSGFARTGGTTGQVQGITQTGAIVTTLNINNNQFGTATADYVNIN